MKKLLVFIFILCTSNFSFSELKGEAVMSDDKLHGLNYQCLNNQCDFFVMKDNLASSLILKVKHGGGVNVVWMNNLLAKIEFSCGSYCHISYFYHIKNGMSNPLQEVIATDANRLCVLLAKNNGLSVENIYTGKSSLKIYYSDSELRINQERAVPYVDMSAKFDASGGLNFEYFDEKDVKRKKYYKNVCHL